MSDETFLPQNALRMHQDISNLLFLAHTYSCYNVNFPSVRLIKSMWYLKHIF